MFLSSAGHAIGRTCLSAIVRRYIVRAGIGKPGSCHLLRHTAATLMMENGADLRSLQMFLGHVQLNTTQLYTHVSIQRLRDVHDKTHPAKPNGQDNDQAKEKQQEQEKQDSNDGPSTD